MDKEEIIADILRLKEKAALQGEDGQGKGGWEGFLKSHPEAVVMLEKVLGGHVLH